MCPDDERGCNGLQYQLITFKIGICKDRPTPTSLNHVSEAIITEKLIKDTVYDHEMLT